MSSSQGDLLDLFKKPTKESPRASSSSLDDLAAAFSSIKTQRQDEEGHTRSKAKQPDSLQEKQPSKKIFGGITSEFSSPKTQEKKLRPPAPTASSAPDSPAKATPKPKALPPIVTGTTPAASTTKGDSSAPESQSKPAYSPEDEADEPAPPVPSFPAGKQVLEGCDSNLRWAFAQIVDETARTWMPQLAGISPGDLEAHRPLLKSEENTGQVMATLSERYGRRMESIGQTTSSEEGEGIAKQALGRVEEMLDHIINRTFQLLREERKEDHGVDQKKNTLNHISRLVKRKANCYEVLGVMPNATADEIKKARNKLALVLHSDRNKDEAAGKCMAGTLRGNALMAWANYIQLSIPHMMFSTMK